MSQVMRYKNETSSEILLTDSAERYLLSCLAKEEGSKGIRLSIKKTGCSGYSYVVNYAAEPLWDDEKQELREGYMLWIEKASYPYLRGMIIDYVRQGLNTKLIFKNPNEKGQCGCGESFIV